ncbi:hypothetical protein VNI00_003075 [Paramarasmius palmivorus]|uniref:F5/8 type C domain-containing protein n=1 Tax=Paramarasmius palmivorus TaxID=297713 RepID=A0AAW0DV51_9AGAR
MVVTGQAAAALFHYDHDHNEDSTNWQAQNEGREWVWLQLDIPTTTLNKYGLRREITRHCYLYERNAFAHYHRFMNSSANPSTCALDLSDIDASRISKTPQASRDLSSTQIPERTHGHLRLPLSTQTPKTLCLRKRVHVQSTTSTWINQLFVHSSALTTPLVEITKAWSTPRLQVTIARKKTNIFVNLIASFQDQTP